MLTENLNKLYIGKSKLTFNTNGRELPPETMVMDVFQPTGMGGRLPNLGTIGVFYPETSKFLITPVWANKHIYLTGIPLGEPLDRYRLHESVWSSYYEDEYRGYFFQILPINVIPRLILE